MHTNEHPATGWGSAFLWGGTGLGVLLAVGLLTHGFGLLGPGGAAGSEPAALIRKDGRIIIPEGSPLRSRLAVAPAAAEPVGAQVRLPAVVESDPARTAPVLTPVAGRLLELRVSLGERVRQGQVLALIDSPDLAQAYADDVRAADTLALAERNLTRQEEQFRLGAASSRDLDQSRSERAQAAAESARTRARLKILGVGAEPPEHASVLAIRAPVGGSITSLGVASGNMINDPTQPLMTVADLSTVWVTALAPEKDLAGIAPEQEAEVVLAARPDQILRGKVLTVGDVLEADSRRDKLRIAFPNPDYALKPNMFATVTLRRPAQSRVVLPASALLMNNDRTSVFVATAPWTFERRNVEAQFEEGTRVAIGSGLQPGEQVVVQGGILLND
ncbi:MAG TPA: efflux RND transporter periplasmic adaptor subunit [Steroidobacteraceae bacterium]|nr:efflux RND transporter periplasmic adaptor subunit [Steroidobacteraceae bacterium]